MDNKLKIAEFMTANPITIQTVARFPEATAIMASKGIGNLVVTEKNNQSVLGLITEREILQYLSLNREIPDKEISFVITQPYTKVTPQETIYAAARAMISNKTRLLVFDSHDDNVKDRPNKLVGIITASDIVRAFRTTDRNPPVEEVMSTKIFDIPYENSIFAAVGILYERRVGSVIVMKDNKPYGIFTERDLLTKVISKGLQLSERVGDSCSTPLITAQHGIRANEAANIMFINNMKRLPLAQGGEVTSIVTARDLVDAFQKEEQSTS
jgi:predicted transcriptional regulator